MACRGALSFYSSEKFGPQQFVYLWGTADALNQVIRRMSKLRVLDWLTILMGRDVASMLGGWRELCCLQPGYFDIGLFEEQNDHFCSKLSDDSML
jgi:hypothetical protein